MFSSPVNTTTPITLSIENLGTVSTLSLTSVTITGAMASEFILTTVPTTIAATSASNLVFDFTPTSTGTRTVTLTIANNDADENPTIINLTGLGGAYFTEPATQATGISFSNILGVFTTLASSKEAKYLSQFKRIFFAGLRTFLNSVGSPVLLFN